MEVTLPRLEFGDVALAAADEATRGERAVAPDVDRFVSIGGPMTLPVTLDALAADDEARPFVVSRGAQSSFHVVHLACSVVPDEHDPLTEVALDFSLARADGQDGPPPVALSMAPDKVDQPVEVSRTIKLGAKLEILDVGVEHGAKGTVRDVYVEALRCLRPDPAWRMHRTPWYEIRGMQKFVMVVEVPKSGATGTLTVTAKVRERRFVVLSHVVSHGDDAPLTFALPG